MNWKIVFLFIFLYSQSHVLVRSLQQDTDLSTVKNKTNLLQEAVRRRRYLTFPDPTDYILIFGLGTPLQLDYESVIIGMFIKLQYTMPVNATDFTLPGIQYNRATTSRWSIYKTFQRIAAIYGYGGKECLLRAICEAAYAPFDGKHSLLGQLLQVFLRPSSSAEEYDEYGDQEYHAAEKLGEQLPDGRCHALYPECHRSLLDVFSTVIT